MDDHAPELWWNPSRLQSTKPLNPEGTVPGSPFGTLSDALEAVDVRRAQRHGSTPKDNVYLVTYVPTGWAVFEYSETRFGKADLHELEPRSLPLGGSIDDPRTYIVDARDVLGRLTGSITAGYDITKIERESSGNPAPPETYLPAYVPESLQNHAGNVHWSPRVSLKPGPDIHELAAALRWLDANLPADVGIKAGGTRHSWSPVCATDGVYVHPEGMRGVSALVSERADSVLKDDVDPEHLFRVVSGTTIRGVNAALWAVGQALPALGGYDGQTLGGVLPTGTHGSVLRRGPLTELVRSVDLVRFGGQTVRVEPRHGAITDPAAFGATHDGWQLVQDDDEFNALLISMGTMGVVHSFTIEARERFWMTEVRTETTWQQAEPVLRGGNIYHLIENVSTPDWVGPADHREFAGHPKPAYHEELLWNPYTGKLVVTSRHPVDAAKTAEFAQNEPPYFANPPVRNLLRALRLDAMPDEYSRPDITELGTEYLRDILDDALEALAKRLPHLLPRFIDSALAGMPDPQFTQRSYNVFNVGDGANRIPAQSGTISVPLRDDMWIDAAHVIQDVAKALASNKRYQTGPISLRFVRGSSILLADPEDVCKFEIIFGGDSEWVKALSRDITAEYYHALYRRFGGDVRLHWGQIIPDGTLDAAKGPAHRVLESYPRYGEWRAIRDRYDPSNRGINPWLNGILP